MVNRGEEKVRVHMNTGKTTAYKSCVTLYYEFSATGLRRICKQWFFPVKSCKIEEIK